MIHPAMQTKHIIAVAAVVVICVVAIAVLALGGDDGNKKYVSDDDSGRLMVFGNANNDDYIDEKDIDTLKKIIAGEMEETKYADANHDGEVNEKDIQYVRDIIDKKVDMVWISQIYNSTEQVVDCSYPLTSVCVAGYETVTVIKSIGAAEYITCLSGLGGESFNPTFYSDVYNLPKVGPDAWNVDVDQLSKYKVQAIVAMDGKSYVKNYETFEQANIDVVRIQAANGLTSLNGIVTLGFLFDCVDRANDEMEFFDGILQDISKKLSTIPADKKVTGLFVTMTNYCEGVTDRSEYTGTMEIAGAKPVADDTVWEGKARKQFFIGDEWLLKEQFQADYIVHSRGLGLGEVDKQKQWDTYSVYFKEMNAYKNGNYFLLNSTLSPVLRIAFMATQFYTDTFGEDYAVNLVQEYYDKFITNVKDFNAKTDATWVITADMVNA